MRPSARYLIYRVGITFAAFGFNPLSFLRSLRGFPRFVSSFIAYIRRGGTISLWNLCPILSDATAPAGNVGGHYFHQDLWAARKIFERRPVRHLDVGSSIEGFAAHVLTFMPLTVLDVRALKSPVPGLEFQQADATDLKGFADGSIDSLSSLHAVEHFGLGRYGDPVDPNACYKAMRSLARVLAPGGRLYFGVPIGRERTEFNAQRVFSPRTVIRSFPGLDLVSFSAVGDDGNLVPNARLEAYDDAWFACGLFEFTKAEGLRT